MIEPFLAEIETSEHIRNAQNKPGEGGATISRPNQWRTSHCEEEFRFLCNAHDHRPEFEESNETWTLLADRMLTLSEAVSLRQDLYTFYGHTQFDDLLRKHNISGASIGVNYEENSQQWHVDDDFVVDDCISDAWMPDSAQNVKSTQQITSVSTGTYSEWEMAECRTTTFATCNVCHHGQKHHLQTADSEANSRYFANDPIYCSGGVCVVAAVVFLWIWMDRRIRSQNVGLQTRSQYMSSQTAKDSSGGQPVRVCVIGGGIAGSTIALALQEATRVFMASSKSSSTSDGRGNVPSQCRKKLFKTTLVEASGSLVDGPPFCHLHAGGNLYREISDQQCLVLLEQCIDVCRLYPHVIERRPTVTLVPKWDTLTPPEKLLPRLEMLKARYKEIIEEYGPSFAVLGDPEEYYKVYSKGDMLRLRYYQEVADGEPLCDADRWMLPVAKGVSSLDDYKYPVILVAESGWNMFRQSATCALALERAANVGDLSSCLTLKTSTKVTGIRSVQTASGKKWEVTMTTSGSNNVTGANVEIHQFDFIVNAAGFQSGIIDNMILETICDEDTVGESFAANSNERRLPVPRRMVEFKSAYMTRWEKVC